MSMRNLILIIVLIFTSNLMASNKPVKKESKKEVVRVYKDKDYKIKRELSFYVPTKKVYV
ncbi:hypothetical protein Phi17:1_gp23 [Cellulophaga phage phi17:1]|uniref:Uncharacterized protein n=1 Tax=Cellulophaga phage phi17:1 TaxID=1327980 RepID=R9ZYB1_9CAUD|nr:hypothetical protein Phi17:1_gp23 [Cellulophaga phage phi17:1]AGO48299.1 hypothetical protein Phi17:1_gp23 [Cellulophaga phage phi17:1]